MGIAFKNITAQSITFGNKPVQSISFGNKQVWPVGNYVSLDKYNKLTSRNGGTDTIGYTANTAVTITSDEGWVTITSTSSTEVNISYPYNSGFLTREAHIIFSIDGVDYATYTLTQDVNYHISIDGSTSRSISSAAGQTSVVVASYYESGDNPIEPSYAITGDMSFESMTHDGHGNYTYVFSYPQNNRSYSVGTTIMFTQPIGIDAIVYYTQSPKYTPALISGFTTFTTYGDWQFGKYYVGSTYIGGQEMPLYAIAIVRKEETLEAYNAWYSATYYTVTTGSPTYYTLYGPKIIQKGATIKISGGDTVYGVRLTTAVNSTITGVSGFTVT